MALKYLSLIACLLFFLRGAECPAGFIVVNGVCYYKTHLDVLQDFIDENQSLHGMEPQEIGYQEWKNNRLTYLYLGDNYIEFIPDSIGLLKDLNNLDLRKNKIKSVSEGICNIYPVYTDINLSENQICPPYPSCFDYIGDQNIKNCGAVKCPIEYVEIDGECYSEEHVQILQSIIDINPSLEGLDLLDLGKDIGYLGWENGNLIHLNLVSHGLTALPESLCSIYKKLVFFDVSNNFICPPYPACFEFLGDQNAEVCSPLDYAAEADSNNTFIDNRSIIPTNDLSNINTEYFYADIEVLQSFIDNNKSLEEMQPLEIGIQTWSNMRIISLDLSSSDLTIIPEEICNFYSNLTMFNISNNAICPPYPECIEYIGIQDIKVCNNFTCPDGYIDIDGECYYELHLNVLQDIINKNISLQNKQPLEITREAGLQKWQNGYLDQLVLNGNELTDLPVSICTIYDELSVFDISNNAICPPYPSCIKNIGHQNTDDCEQNLLFCEEGFVTFDNKCYFYDDLQVLIDFTKLNPNIESYHPLLLGYQLWKNGHLSQMSLDGWNITVVPESINKLEYLEYLNLNNNLLAGLPEALCDIYSDLKYFNVSNNSICAPYVECLEDVGIQNNLDCIYTKQCPEGCVEFSEDCYNYEDLQVLADFTKLNPSIKSYNPLLLGYQVWENSRLIELYLDGLNIISIPENINMLDRLEYLNLNNNYITSLPENLCVLLKNIKHFDVFNNFICSPYPACFEFIGYQNTNGCVSSDYIAESSSDNTFIDNRNIMITNDLSNISTESFHDDIKVLQIIVDNNVSLYGQNPLKIGRQKWINMRLKSLDLSSLGITYLPEALCEIYPNLTKFDVDNNEICSPYPTCFDYIGDQNCPIDICPTGYIKIDGRCYHSEHIIFLESLIDSNATLREADPALTPLNVVKEFRLLKWKNGKMEKIVLTDNSLTKIPENICNIYDDISLFNISNNALCPPYPICLENLGYQNLEDCEDISHSLPSCQDGYVSFDNKCYYNDDLQILIDFITLNPGIESNNPLLLGYQLWKNNRLFGLNLDGWNIVVVPENINKLKHLEYLNLNNNFLSSIPENLCEIYGNLQEFQISNNLICPPYPNCFDFLGQQNTKNCEYDSCFYGYLEIDGECYYEKDISVLQDFIDLNESLNGKKPLEIGVQKWKNKRLDFLYLGVNQLSEIPSSICEIHSNLRKINISQNNICPPYPDCIEEYVGEQNTSGCAQ